MGLRKGQKELVERYRGGKCAIPAIPGGGKTHCLSLWAVEMISNGYHKPGKILIVTYMNSAVNNFKQRISAELQKRGINGSKDYFVSTIHGLCLQIIKEKPDLIIANEEFEIIDEVSKIHLISSAIDEWKRYNEREFQLYLDMENLSSGKMGDIYKNWQDKLCRIMLSAISDFKVKGITPSEAKEKCKSLGKDSILSWASDIFEIYDRRLKIGGFLDFDDMLYNAKKMLETDEHLLEKYRKKYSFVCEDEAQDSNYIQNEILTLIANGNLLRVGDSNQAICGSFSSSDFTLFKGFCDAPDTMVYSITQSSRNTRDIIDLANYFVRYVRENHPVPQCRDSLLPQYIEPVAEDDPRPNPVIDEYGIKAAVFESWEEEARGVVTQAMHMIKKHPDKTIAILVPSAWKMSLVINILESRKAPFEQLDNTSGERNGTLKKLGRIIDFLAVPEDGEKFSNMINECILTGTYDSPDFADTEDEVKTMGQRELLSGFLKKYPVEKLLYPVGGIIEIADVPQELLQANIWKDFVDCLDMVRELLEFPNTIVEKLILFISEKLRFDREERAIAQKVAGDVRYLMNQNPRWRLSDLALELLSPKNMFNYFAGIVWDLKGFEPQPGVITVATYHKSKGLEWDIVFLTGLNNADFPVLLEDKFMGEFWFLKEQYKNPQAIIKSEMAKVFEGKIGRDSILESKLETISEKARLLYVGITRAKEYLFLSSYELSKGKRVELPSRYILELRQYIEEAGRI
ncbi:ATP-dependent helicase [Acetivibrio mesophilus]|uniref:DNA 3'-5' helicase n=1 Tax=Acetivibrio mesophilus TaxID=2487273 RepID=A0A4Q0I3D2_9FIRM|nr:ATP-dependent helicase [Acetivibrio mesophilus]ODM25958.1 DNA helicase UvrD [Clostridium sp. Bc-iso-3]RXE58205.1 ATP-dependent helicase [Acetivibrio mesophilus]